MVVNSLRPTSQETELLRQELAEQHDMPVLAMNIESMTEHDVYSVLREALYEFSVLEVNVNLPSWVMVLNENHWLRENYQEAIQSTVKNIKRLRRSEEHTSELQSRGHLVCRL